MRTKRYTVIVASVVIVASCLCACSAKEEFLNERAYRDETEADLVLLEETDDPFITDGYMMSEDERKSVLEAFDIMNSVREDEGLGPLKWDEGLEYCAKLRAEELASSFSHARPNGKHWFTTRPDIMLGENACKGSEHADIVMDAWMNNQPDRENFLYEGFTRAAFALYKDDKSQCYWVCEFGDDSVKRSESMNDTKDEKMSKEGKGEHGEYDGMWYAQDDSGATLIINKGLMLLEYGDIEDEADFEPKEEDDRIVLAEVSDGDIPFWFYEINYYPDDERVEAYTWPVLDDDGGYKRTIFKRDEYEPGDENMMGLLYGDWEIMDDGEMIQEPGIRRDIVHFSLPDYHMMRFIRPNGDMTTFSIELTDVFEENPKAYDRMILSNKFVSGMYSWDEVRPEQSFQIMIANNLGIDYMMLRELGDERTGFVSDGLKYDRSAAGIWFFRRPDPNEYDGKYESLITTPSTVGLEDEVRMKNTSFYAIKWQEFGNSCTLQRVEVASTIVTIDGEDENALAYSIPNDKYAYSAVNYEYSGRDNMAHGGYFDPGLVYVTTDKRGRITEMVRFNYALDGMYYE